MSFMLGSACSTCCEKPCVCQCTKGTLPETVTVTFSGQFGNKSAGDGLLSLNFVSCFGGGATGTAEAQGGLSAADGGGISGVTLTSGGSGYAKFGRKAPAMTLATPATVPADVEITLGSETDTCGVPTFRVVSVTVNSGGYGHESADLSLTPSIGTITEAAAIGSLVLGRDQPTVTASPPSGSSASFSVSMSSNGDDTWGVESVSVSGTKAGHADGATLTLSAGVATVEEAAHCVIRTGRVEPAVSVAASSATGSGAVLSATLTKTSDYSDWPIARDAWTVSGVSVSNGGSGYAAGDPVSATATDGQASTDPWSAFSAEVDSVDEDGAILSVSVWSGGVFYKSDGVIDDVYVANRGRYYIDGVLQSVNIEDGGRYYLNDPTLSPYVAGVTVSVGQGWPSAGTGAQVSATVNADTSSPNFGRIASITLVSGGSGYLGFQWQYSCDCEWVYGQPIGTAYSVVAYRAAPWSCEYYGFRCWNETLLLPPAQMTGIGLYGALITAKVSSTLCTQTGDFSSGYFVAPRGIPGVDGGAITSWFGDIKNLCATGNVGSPWCGGLWDNFAIPGRTHVIANRLNPGGHTVSSSMVQEFHEGLLPYWKVNAVTVPPGIAGIANGQEVTIYWSGAGPDSAYTDGLTRGYRTNTPPIRRAATGTAIVEAGQLVGVTITDQGVFYKQVESDEEPAIAPSVTVEIVQRPPSAGTGATVTATINTNTRSSSFGRPTFSIGSGGSGYLGAATGYRSFVVRHCGPESPPRAEIACDDVASLVHRSADLITNCGTFSFQAEAGDGIVSVVPGGDPDDVFVGRNKCCGKCDIICPESPTQVTINLTRPASVGVWPDGTSVTCPSDTLEVVYDIADLLAEQDCQILVDRSVDAIADSNNFYEQAAARVELLVFGQPGQAVSNMSASERTTWGGLAGLGSNPFRSIRTITRTLIPSKECSQYPGGDWTESETTSGPMIPVGGSYGPRVRICQDYEIEVAFQ